MVLDYSAPYHPEQKYPPIWVSSPLFVLPSAVVSSVPVCLCGDQEGDNLDVLEDLFERHWVDELACICATGGTALLTSDV